MNVPAIQLSSGRGVDDLALDGFPVVDDFAVTLSDDEEKTLLFFSPRQGRLAGFPAWEHADRDLRHFTAYDVPMGPIHEAFEERDENWRIVIFQDGGWVYVLEGDDPNATTFPRYFRVPTGRYLAAWAALIELYNPVQPLDEA